MTARFFGSQSSLREANRATLLKTVRNYGAMTQVELAENTGLSTATVSNLVRQLVDEDVVETKATIRNGRRATLVALTRRQGIGVGVHIERRHMRVVLMDFAKVVLSERGMPLALNHRPDSTIERIMVLIKEMVSAIGAAIDEIVGIGLAVGAPLDYRTHAVAIPGILHGWEGLDLTVPFRTAFNVPVNVDNDANASAFTEMRIGAANGVDNFVYIHADDGVGSGIVINGRLLRGITGLAGEIGHIQVDPLGSICSCGNRGCLNTVVDEDRLVSLLSVTHGNMTLEDLVKMTNDADPGCRRVVSDAALRIGSVAADLCICVDPEIVVLGGTLSTTGDVFLDPFRESLQRLLFPDALTPMQVRSAAHPVFNAAIGGALMSIEKADNTIGIRS
ncbi:MAG: ROK family transcriptional regulator [Bifidobacterium psychraerophilum]|uniref:ROK family transcriptional regulator n=1 Tax=Bifidobacterium psychraerophilum TaxID=218140 RepID=UPI0039E74D13